MSLSVSQGHASNPARSTQPESVSDKAVLLGVLVLVRQLMVLLLRQWRWPREACSGGCLDRSQSRSDWAAAQVERRKTVCRGTHHVAKSESR